VEETSRVPSSDIAGRVAAVRARVEAAARRAGRDPAAVRLVAVTKTVPAARIVEALAAGVRDLGENRVQEALAKRPAVPPGARWHLVGHLQANKARLAARLFDCVHSLDSERIGERLDHLRDPGRPPLEVLVEVDFTGIDGRTGVSPETAEGVLRAAARLGRLDLRGLMTIAPYGDPDAARACFRRLRELRDRLQERLAQPLPELSMGMSDDFEVGVEEGATMVRLGRAIFGERPG
jgi:pyridoxal phosphate enzyme (YggS family)